MDKYRIVISEQAKIDVGNHVAFLAAKNVDAACALQRRLIAEIRSLSDFPMRYPFFNEPHIPPNKYHKLFVEKYYLILYQVKDDTVYVDLILDTRQDLPWLM